MSSSDVRMFDELVARVDALAARIFALEERVGGKDMHQELYGPEVDHTEERAELRRGPGRPPKASF